MLNTTIVVNSAVESEILMFLMQLELLCYHFLVATNKINIKINTLLLI